MIWNKKPTPDYYRWRKRFALFPKRIGQRKVWLEHYAWRYMYRFNITETGVFQTWNEYVLKRDGYMALECHTSYMIGGCSSVTWHKPKADLKVVS